MYKLYYLSQPRLAVSFEDYKCPTFFSARSPMFEVQRFDYYAVTCSVAATPYRTPLPFPLCFRRASRYDILRGSVTEVPMAVILLQYEGALGKMKDKFICLVHCVTYCTCMVRYVCV